jgi:hypothetical protein
MAFPINPVDGQVYNKYKYNLSNSLWETNYQDGKIIQTIETTYGAQFNLTQNLWLPLKGTITPKKIDSKILVMIHIDGVVDIVAGANYGFFTVYKNKVTNLRNFGYPKGWDSVDNGSGTTIDAQLVDSPNTLSEITYDIIWNETAPTSGIQINRDGATYCMSSIILIEIGA